MDKDERAQHIKEHWDELEEVASEMWQDEFADTVLQMLAEDRTVTAETLRDEFETRMIAEGADRLTRSKYRGCLKQLRK